MPTLARRPLALLTALALVATLLVAVAAPARASEPTPQASLSVPSSALIGSELNFTATFDNVAATATGYGPYIDLFMPVQGANGDPTATPAEAPDGISLTDAAYLGASITVIDVTLACDGTDVHPLTGLPVTCPAGTGPGDVLHVLELPFGSFTPTQPPAPVALTASVSELATLDTPLPIHAQAGFRYGADPLDNPNVDPPILQDPPTTSEVTPTLAQLDKTYSGPENETATGPNFPRTWTLQLTVADGQTLDNVVLTDLLPDNVAYLSATTGIASGTVVTEPAVDEASNPPDNEVVAEFAEVVGNGGVSATLAVEFYVPEFDAGGAPVLSPTTGAPQLSPNTGRAEGSWEPLDPRDPTTVVEIDPGAPLHTLIDRSLAIQKSVSVIQGPNTAGTSPGDTLEWTLNFQVSDFFTFDSLVIEDVLSDGQSIDPSFTPTLSFDDPEGSTSGFDLSDYVTEVVDDAPACDSDGQINYDIALSDAVDAAVPATGGVLTGGLVDGTDDGPTQGTITFRTIIEDRYRCVDAGQAVDSRDSITNSVTIFGDVLDNETGVPTGSPVTDGSGAGVTIVSPSLSKTVYARNGNTSDIGPQFAAGDTITYRLTATLPITNFENVALLDFLPLPTLDATEVTDTTLLSSGPSATPPPAGAVSFGPGETLADVAGGPGSAPSLSVDPVGNSLTFDYSPDIQDQDGESSATIDLLFTVTLTDAPFADGLFLTNQARLVYSDSFADVETNDEIVQFELTNPVLDLTKGVVAVDGNGTLTGPAGPGGPWSTTGTPRFTPTLNSTALSGGTVGTNVTGAWEGDLIAYALVVENTGSGLNGVFDVTVEDEIPAGMAIPSGGAQVQVTDGAGDSLDHTGDLFSGGITLTDPGPTTGSLSPFDASSGTNIAVITYVLEVDEAGMADQIVNEATLTNYAAAPDGPSYPERDDDAMVTMASPQVSKTLTDTLESHTSSPDATIGEQVTYQVEVTIPPSTTDDVVLRDTLPVGMAFVSFDSLTADADLSSSEGTFAAILSGLGSSDVSNGGRQLDIDLGTVTNSGSSPATLTFEFTAAVRNVSGNQDTTNPNQRRNSAQLRVDGSNLASNLSAGVRIVEPDLTITKSADPTTADAGDIVTFTIEVNHPTAARTATAFDVVLTDTIPTGLTYVPGTFDVTGGLTPDSTDDGSAPDLTATWDDFPTGESTTLTYQATVDPDAAQTAGGAITNTAELDWTSLPGAAPSESPYVSDDVQRTGADGPGGLNDYVSSDDATLDPVPSEVVKSFVTGDQAHTSGSDLTIGETATYELTVTLPEGDIGVVSVTDDIPAGMAYVGGSVTVDHSSFGGTLGDPGVNLDPAGGSNGDNLVLTFDGFGPGVSSTPTPGTTGTTFTVTYDTIVLDVPGNAGGDTRTNQAWVTVAGVDSDPDSAPVDLVEPDVTITKSFDPDEAAANDPTTITLTVTNEGDADSFDLEVTDVIDSDVFTNVTVTSVETGWTDATAAGPGDDTTVAFTFAGPFEPGDTATFEVGVVLVTNLHENVTVPGSQTNTAEVTSASVPAGTSDERRTYSDDDSDDLALVVPDLVTTKSGPTAVNPGQTFTYTIVVENVGDRDASGVTIVDEIPDRPWLTYDSNTGGGTFDPDAGPNGTVTWNIGDLAAGDDVTVTVDLTVDATVPVGTDGSTFANTADAQHDGSSGPDPTPENNDDDHTVTLDATIDVALSKTAQASEVGTGDTLTYEIEVTNVGNEDVENITVTDTLPDHTSFVSASGGGSHDDGEVTWTGIDLDAGSGPGTSITLTVTVEVDDTVPAGVDTLTNSATVDAPGDTNPANDDDTAEVDLDAAPVLTLTKTDDADGGLVAPGDTLVYTLTIANVGDQGATGIVVTDDLPDGVTFVSASDGGSHSAGVVTWTLADQLAAGDDFELTLTVTVNDPLPADTDELVNNAEVTDDGENSDEPTTDDDEATTRLNITSISKALTDTSADHTSGDELVVGETATYTLTVQLPEGDDLGTVTVTDLIPAGMAYVPDTATVDTTGFEGLLTVSNVNLDGQPLSEGAPLIITFDDVEVTTDGDPATATFTVTFDALVLDVTGNVDQTVRTNTASTTVAGATFTSNDVDITVVEPEVEITKTFGFPDAASGDTPGTAASGDTVTVTLDVENTGDVDAFDLEVTDVLDGDTFTSVAVTSTPAGWTAAVDTSGTDPVLTATGPELAAGDDVTIVLEMTVTSAVSPGDSLVNTAQVTWQSLTGDDPHTRDYGPATDTDTIGFTVPDLRVVKTRDGTGIVEPGDQVTFEIVVHNDGGRQAAGVTLTDVLPDHTTFVTASDSGSHDAGEVTWNLGTIAAGASTSVTVTVEVDDPVPAGTATLTNTASATDDGTRGDDPTPDNNEDTAVIPLEAFVDVAVTKTADETEATTGQQITFTILVENLGNEGVDNVTVTDVLPDHTTFVAAGGSAYTHDDGVVTWTGIDLDGVGEDNTIWLTVTVEVDDTVPAGVDELVNTVTVDADGDINDANDSDDATVPLIAGPDLRLTKTVDVDEAATGDTLTYTLTVTNDGDQGATGITLVDELPDGVTFASASDDGVHDDGEVTWTFADELAAGDSITVELTVTVDAPLPDGTVALTNTATTSDDGTNGADPTQENNTDDATVVTGADLVAGKELVGALIPGDTATYLITVTNNGPEPLTELFLVDTPGPGLTDPAFTPDQGTYDPATGIWSGVDLTPGQSVTMEVTVNVAVTLTDPTFNQVDVTTPNGVGDPDPDNNTDTTEDDPTPLVNVRLTKELVEVEAAGGQAVYLLTVTNDGPSNATEVTLTDDLPGGLTVADIDADGWTCTVDDELTELSCELDGLLAPEMSATVLLTADIDPDLGGEVVNLASVTVTEEETTLEDNSDAAVFVLASLTNVDFVSECRDDAVWLNWQIDVADTDADTVSLTFVNPDGDDLVYDDLPLTGELLWPGTELDDDGTPTNWPGWSLVDGVWIEGDGFDWVRGDTDVTVRINPVGTFTVSYPPATADCAGDPPPEELPDTGVRSTTLALLALLLLGVGVGTVLAGTRVRRRPAR